MIPIILNSSLCGQEGSRSKVGPLLEGYPSSKCTFTPKPARTHQPELKPQDTARLSFTSCNALCLSRVSHFVAAAAAVLSFSSMHHPY